MGDDFTLLYDAVQRYNYYEALRVGRALDEYGYVSFEDPMQTTDLEGLIELREAPGRAHRGRRVPGTSTTTASISGGAPWESRG